MLDLRNVLELVNNRLDDGPLASEKLVRQTHQVVFHVPPGLGVELNATGLEQLQRQLLRDISSVSEYLAKQPLEQVHHWLSVIGISRSEGDVEQFTMLIDD